MGRGAWRATVYGIERVRHNQVTNSFSFHIGIYLCSFYILFHYRLLQYTEYSFLCYTVCPSWFSILYISLVQSLSPVRLFAMPWTAACQASPSITNSQSLLKLMSIESVMPFNHLILSHPLLLLPSTFPSIRVFSNVLQSRWPKYWSVSISPSNEC